MTASCFSKIDSLDINDMFNESSLVINSIGRPSASIDRVDTFLVIKLKNDIFRELRDKLFSVKRKGHIVFDSPFKYQFCCSFHMPEGYVMKSSIGEHSFNTSFKGGFRITLNQKNDNVELIGN